MFKVFLWIRFMNKSDTFVSFSKAEHCTVNIYLPMCCVFDVG